MLYYVILCYKKSPHSHRGPKGPLRLWGKLFGGFKLDNITSIQCSVIQYSAVFYKVHCNIFQFVTIHYSTIHYNTEEYNKFPGHRRLIYSIATYHISTWPKFSLGQYILTWLCVRNQYIPIVPNVKCLRPIMPRSKCVGPIVLRAKCVGPIVSRSNRSGPIVPGTNSVQVQ